MSSLSIDHSMSKLNRRCHQYLFFKIRNIRFSLLFTLVVDCQCHTFFFVVKSINPNMYSIRKYITEEGFDCLTLVCDALSQFFFLSTKQQWDNFICVSSHENMI